VPYALFAVGCALSATASWYVSSTATSAAEDTARAEFLGDSEQMRRHIQAGVDSYIEVVRAGAVLLSADNEIQGSEFRRFISGLRLAERYPGLDGLGFAPCVGSRDLRRFLRLVDLDGNPIRIWPKATRSSYCPTLFFAPGTESNKKSVGFDLRSVRAIDDAMIRARDSGEPAASALLDTLPAWRQDESHVLLLIPVYRSNAPLPTAAARRRALVGFVFGPLSPKRLLGSIADSTMLSVAFEVYDGQTQTADTLITRSSPAPGGGQYRLPGEVQVADREWHVTMQSQAPPANVSQLPSQQALYAGVALSLMLFIVMRAQVRGWETAARHEGELRTSAEALRESESQARAANVAKDEFLATVSHELRTPLNVVLGWVGMLRRGSVPAERLPHALEIIERNAKQQAQLIDDLLDVSRIVTGQLRLEQRVVAVAPLASAVVEALRPVAEAKSVELIADMPDPGCSVMGDADRLRQTVWNVVANAIKFTPGGGHVFVELRLTENRVRLTVRDTGVGIRSDFLPHVFERFRQADSSTTRVHSGVGLGLAIARHLIELHGGSINAMSEGEGRGATFVIELPAAAISGHQLVAAVSPAARALAPSHLVGVRVLLVDDDAGTLEMLCTALRSTGAQVLAASSAREGLERLTSEGADVLVSDIAMAGEDGFWLIQRVRSLNNEQRWTPAIALTALARTEDRDRVIAAGYQMHVPKPVELSELQTLVARLASGSASLTRQTAV
jgi:signal transduction histidine kinase/CheY-like chemotaxis protein